MLSTFRAQPIECTQYQYFHIQSKDSNEEFLPSDPSVWSIHWDCTDFLTEILVGNLLINSPEPWLFLIYLLLPSCCKSENTENVLSTQVLRCILNVHQLIRLVSSVFCLNQCHRVKIANSSIVKNDVQINFIRNGFAWSWYPLILIAIFLKFWSSIIYCKPIFCL